MCRAVLDLNADGTRSYWAITCADIHQSVIDARRDRLLSQAGVLVAAATNYRDQMPEVLRLLAPDFCDFAALHTHALDHLPELIARTDDRIECDMRTIEQVRATGLPMILGAGRVTYTDASVEPLHTFVVLPILARGETVGTLALGFNEERERNGDDLEAMRQLADRLGATIDNAALYASAQMEIAERKRAERELRESEELFRTTTESMPHVVWIANADGVVNFINHHWHKFVASVRDDDESEATIDAATKLEAKAQVEGSHDWLQHLHEDDTKRLRNAWRSSVRTLAPLEQEARLRRGVDGTYLWHLVRAVPVFDHNGHALRWIGTLTNIDDQRRAEAQSRFLSHVSNELMHQLGFAAILKTVSNALVPEHTDWLSLDLVTDEGETRRVLSVHHDPEKERLLADLYERFPSAKNSRYGYPRVIKTGRSQLVSPVTAGTLEATAKNAEHRDLLQQAGIRSMLCVPLITRGRVIGCLTACITERRRLFDQRDLVLLEDLASRIAVMVDNATLMHSE